VRFVDLLKTTVMLSGAAATMLAVVTVIGATHDKDETLVLIATGWWIAGAIIGAALGRRAQVTAPIGRLLADAKQATMLPEHRPGAVILNRLWPLLASTVAAGAIGFLFPQVPAVACGFAIIWSLACVRQDSAVLAVEERDGVSYYVERTSPIRPMQLVRTPGLRREVGRRSRRSTERAERRGGRDPHRLVGVDVRPARRRRRVRGGLSSARAPTSRWSRPGRRARCGPWPSPTSSGARAAARGGRARDCRSPPARGPSTPRSRPRCCGRGRARSANDAPRPPTAPAATGCGSARSSGRRLREAPLLVPQAPGTLAESPSPHAPAVVVPIPVEPSGPAAPERDIAAINLRSQPREEGPRSRARRVGRGAGARTRSCW